MLAGMSVMEMSHRGKEFQSIIDQVCVLGVGGGVRQGWVGMWAGG